MTSPQRGTTTPGGPEPALDHLRAEIGRLRQEAVHQRRLAHRRAERWNTAHILLGFPAALLAGTAGAAGLSSPDARVPAALIALASAGFAAGAGFLRGDVRCQANKRARGAWGAVEDVATLALSQPHPSTDDLAALFPLRQAALAAYDAGDAQPSGARPPCHPAEPGHGGRGRRGRDRDRRGWWAPPSGSRIWTTRCNTSSTPV